MSEITEKYLTEKSDEPHSVKRVQGIVYKDSGLYNDYRFEYKEIDHFASDLQKGVRKQADEFARFKESFLSNPEKLRKLKSISRDLRKLANKKEFKDIMGWR
jgi:hypothetical protein